MNQCLTCKGKVKGLLPQLLDQKETSVFSTRDFNTALKLSGKAIRKKNKVTSSKLEKKNTKISMAVEYDAEHGRL